MDAKVATATKPAQVQVMKPQEMVPLKLGEEIEARTEQFAASLPAHIPVERFKKVLIVAVNSNPALVKADRRTFFNSALKAANDGLLPDGREGALVIYKTKSKEGGQEKWIEAVQWMPMIGGIRKKVRNSGEIETWNAYVVHEKDSFTYELGLEPTLTHKPALSGPRGKAIGAYSVAKLKSGEITFEFMTADEIWAVWQKASKNKDKDGKPAGPWRDYEGEMFRKTVARRHSKVLPMSTDLDDLIRRDDDLYDFKGTGDQEVKPKDVTPARPKLSEFTKGNGEEKPADEEAQEGEQATGETSGAEEGESAEDADYGHADAHTDGQKAFAEGVAIENVPKAVKQLGFAESWTEGWKSASDEAGADGQQQQ